MHDDTVAMVDNDDATLVAIYSLYILDVYRWIE